jgi:hypothetical protein
VTALFTDVVVALIQLPARDLVVGLFLMAAVLAYLFSHQWLHRHARWRVPKEVCIAVLLMAGVWLFVRGASAWQLWAPLALFGLLCLTNTSLISRWEMDVDRRQGQSSLALDSPRAVRMIVWLPWVTLVAAAATLAAGPPAARLIAVSAAVSALLFAAIDLIEPRTGWALARVLSDLALMTPIVALVAG